VKPIRVLYCEKSSSSEFLRSPYSVCFTYFFQLRFYFLSLSILLRNSKLDRNRLSLYSILQFHLMGVVINSNNILDIKGATRPSPCCSVPISAGHISWFIWFSSLQCKRLIETVERPRFPRDDPQKTRSIRNPVWFLFFRISSFPLSNNVYMYF